MAVEWLDRTKYGMQQHLSRLYKDAKAKAPPEEFEVFESWFWQIRPLLSVDWVVYSPQSSNETSGPNLQTSQGINTVEQ